MRSPFEIKRFRAANRRRHKLISLYFLRGLTRQEQRKLDYLERVCDRVEAEYNRRIGIKFGGEE